MRRNSITAGAKTKPCLCTENWSISYLTGMPRWAISQILSPPSTWRLWFFFFSFFKSFCFFSCFCLLEEHNPVTQCVFTTTIQIDQPTKLWTPLPGNKQIIYTVYGIYIYIRNFCSSVHRNFFFHRFIVVLPIPVGHKNLKSDLNPVINSYAIPTSCVSENCMDFSPSYLWTSKKIFRVTP